MLLGSIFISHSKHDENIVNYFSKAFGRVGLPFKLMEVEDLSKRYAGYEVLNLIRSECDGVAVLLGRKLLSRPTSTPEYTHNWVNFEVGAAAGIGKPVWVFEDYREHIRFPIPYVTDYLQYELNNDEHLRLIGELVKANLTSRLNYAPVIICPHDSCNAAYYYWNELQQIYCPVCRQSIPKYEERKDRRINLSNL